MASGWLSQFGQVVVCDSRLCGWIFKDDYFLQCSTNNAMTVFFAFKSAINEYGVPSHVRSDKWGEHFSLPIYGYC